MKKIDETKEKGISGEKARQDTAIAVSIEHAEYISKAIPRLGATKKEVLARIISVWILSEKSAASVPTKGAA